MSVVQEEEELPLQYQCVDCKGMFEEDQCQKYGARMKCKSCHSSYRYLRDNMTGWNKLTAEEKRAHIVQNRDKGGRGKKREIALASTTEAPPSSRVQFRQGRAAVFRGVHAHA